MQAILSNVSAQLQNPGNLEEKGTDMRWLTAYASLGVIRHKKKNDSNISDN